MAQLWNGMRFPKIYTTQIFLKNVFPLEFTFLILNLFFRLISSVLRNKWFVFVVSGFTGGSGYSRLHSILLVFLLQKCNFMDIAQTQKDKAQITHYYSFFHANNINVESLWVREKLLLNPLMEHYSIFWIEMKSQS